MRVAGNSDGRHFWRPPGVDVPVILFLEFHVDLLRLLLGRLRHGDGQYAMLELRFDVAFIDSFGKGEAAFEATAGALADEVVGLSLVALLLGLGFAERGDLQYVLVDVDIDVLLAVTGKFGFQYVGVLVFPDVHRGYFGCGKSPIVPKAVEQAVEVASNAQCVRVSVNDVFHNYTSVIFDSCSLASFTGHSYTCNKRAKFQGTISKKN